MLLLQTVHVVDHLSPEGRSRNMSAIRAKDTKPELALRAALRLVGATGYRLHRKDVPGRPDIVFMKWKVAVFVDGVFWHGHPDHWHPETASDYWRNKIARTVERDRIANARLDEAGWAVIRVWDEEIKADVGHCSQLVVDALTIHGWRAPSAVFPSGGY